MLNKCESCIHRKSVDAEQCLKCREAAPSGANAALAVVLALLFNLAVVAIVDAIRFESPGQGMIASLFVKHAEAERPATADTLSSTPLPLADASPR